MTPRKELFIAIKKQLSKIDGLELVDLFRNQFGSGKRNYPEIWTAALIRINSINWETMVEYGQEGNAEIDILFYCKDGWMDQHHTTDDPEHGLIEIDLIDAIAEKLQFLSGIQFKPLQQISDETLDQEADGIMSYSISFSTRVYRKLNKQYPNKIKLSI